jgi:hypothetical protein
MNEEKQHEERDADVGSLFMVALLLFLGGAILFLGTYVMLHYFSLHEPAKIARHDNLPLQPVENFPRPRLLVRPGGNLQQFRAAEDADLNSYGWVNRDAGVVRVPVARAMQLLLQRGLPDVGAGQTPLSLMQARPSETVSPPRLKPPSAP